jgi:ABC-type multidrug transport system ATPase subunit
MGASGAGKTTLLDVLADRKNVGVITGDVLIDAKPRGIEFQRGTAYCEQIDVHEDTQTVREALRFSAYLRQPYHVSKEEKDAYVEQVISLLEMEAIADAEIGNPVVGLSVAERKRVTIGVELAAKPELLLFLDEPSSGTFLFLSILIAGLDSQSAFNIIRFLRKLAQAGQAILCTIHQPNDSLFEQFDRLLLLQRGGRTVYFGEIGNDACVLRDYFKRNGAECPPHHNPAEFMLEAIGAGSRPRVGDRDWSDIWQDSPELEEVKKQITRLKDERRDAPLDLKAGKGEYATPLMYQMKVVLRRMNLTFWRSPNYGTIPLIRS